MIVDNEQQKRMLLDLVKALAPQLTFDASEKSLQQYTQLVELRRAIEGATLARKE